MGLHVYSPVVTQTMIDAKGFTLPYTPSSPSEVLLDINAGSPQRYGIDFTISGNFLSWNGLSLDGNVFLPDPPADPIGTIFRVVIPYDNSSPSPAPTPIPVGGFVVPSVADFKSMFARDFPFGPTNDAVMDSDISRAIFESSTMINAGLFDYQATFSSAFLYLSAHNLVMNIRASSQGIAGTYSWLESSKGVGSVSQSFAIPGDITSNPLYSMYTKTTYGAKYLSLVLPYLYGNMGIVAGETLS